MAIGLVSLAVELAALPARTAGQRPGEPQDTVRARAPTGPIRATVPCEILQVVDGDTIECRDHGRVRLIGIDTPELGQEPFGTMARAALVSALDSTTVVALEPDVEARDRYGRILAYVWRGEMMINWWLVRGGWAVLLTYPPNVQYVEALTTAQHRAREEKAGLWALDGFECLPRDWRQGRC